MVLTKQDILFILERIGEKTVVEPTKAFPYRVSCEGRGYSDDKKVGALQAKLSIMLEMAR
jgi:hypothetical protein